MIKRGDMDAMLTRILFCIKEELYFLEFPSMFGSKLVLTSRKKILWYLEGGSKTAVIMLSGLV